MICKKCGWWDRICHCGELSIFNTTKDRLFHFTDIDTFGKPVEVSGKDHFDRLCKERGLTWRDVKQARRKISDWKKHEVKKYGQKEIAHDISMELKEKGLYKKLLKRKK